MANQSKSMVFGFVIIAAIIFAVALGYRMTQQDSSPEPQVNEPVVEQEKEPEIKVVSYDEEKVDMSQRPTPEEQKEIAERSPFFMKFAMRYQSGEEAVNDLPVLIEHDKFEEAEYLIKFINSQYPDTTIPDEFADL